MVSVELISAWLRTVIRQEWILEIWIFGSVAMKAENPNDVDVFVKYRGERSREIPPLRRELEFKFLQSFHVPLHLLLLTEQECFEQSVFLGNALARGVRVK